MRTFQVLLLTLILLSCNNITREEKKIRDNIGKNITTEMIITLQNFATEMNFNDFREKLDISD